MNKRISWLATLLMVVGISTWALGADKGASDHPRARAEVGKPAPDFTLKDLAGKDVSLSSFKGKVVVLEWTNHKCPFIKRHEAKKKTMQKTIAKFAGKPVAWLAIDSSSFCGEKIDEIRDWSKENQLSFPTLLDAAGKVGHLYGAKSTPHMFVIDQKGVLAYTGAIDDDPQGDKETTKNYVAEAVTSLLNGSTVATAHTKSYGCSIKYAK